MNEKPQIIFTPPSRSTPGYLRRTRQALAFNRAFQSGEMTPELLDNMVEFLLDYVTKPDRDEARELLFDASEEQFDAMLASFSVGGDDNNVNAPLPSETETT